MPAARHRTALVSLGARPWRGEAHAQGMVAGMMLLASCWRSAVSAGHRMPRPARPGRRRRRSGRCVRCMTRLDGWNHAYRVSGQSAGGRRGLRPGVAAAGATGGDAFPQQAPAMPATSATPAARCGSPVAQTGLAKLPDAAALAAWMQARGDARSLGAAESRRRGGHLAVSATAACSRPTVAAMACWVRTGPPRRGVSLRFPKQLRARAAARGAAGRAVLAPARPCAGQRDGGVNARSVVAGALARDALDASDGGEDRPVRLGLARAVRPPCRRGWPD